MKTLVMQTVHALLAQSGQGVPAKHMSIDANSLQVYDVEHWPESFNSLLVHDFPSILISVDSSDASLSGFVVTLRWDAAVDISAMACAVVHLVVATCVLCLLARACFVSFALVSPHEMLRIAELCRAGPAAASRGFGAPAPPSPFTDELRGYMAHSEF